MTHEIIIGCDGSGPLIDYKTIQWPNYTNGGAAFDWHPPDAMPEAKRERVLARMEKHRKQIIKIMDKAAQGFELDDDEEYPPGT